MIPVNTIITKTYFNNYRVVQHAPGGCFEVECVEFYCEEDLGDGILCARIGQKIWVADYHETNFYVIA